MFSRIVAGVPAVLLVLATACSEPEPPPAPTTGDIEGTLTVEGGDLAGAVVSIPGVVSAPDATGKFRFTGLAKGEYTLVATKPGYVNATAKATVEVGKKANVELSLAKENRPPLLASFTASPSVLARGQLGQLLAVATDPDGDTLAFEFTAGEGWTIEAGGEPGVASITAPDLSEASTTVRVAVTDGRGGRAEGALLISTSRNGAPVLAAVSATPPLVAPGATLKLSASAADPDGDELSYAWTAPEGWTVAGEGAEVSLTAPATHGVSGLVTVVVSDAGGARATGSVSVMTTGNLVPVFSSLVAQPNPAAPGAAITVTAAAVDPDGSALTFSWAADEGWVVTGSGASVTITAPMLHAASGTVRVTADDGHGGTTVASVALSTTRNGAPIIAAITATPPQLRPGGSTHVKVTASDPDGEDVTFTWSAPEGWTLEGEGSEVKLTAPVQYDATAELSVEVADPFGAKTTSRVTVSTISNDGPLVQSITAVPPQVAPRGELRASVLATDPGGDALTYAWTAPEGWTFKDDVSTGAEVVLVAPAKYGDTKSLAVTVSDGHTNASASVVVSTAANRAPAVASLVARPLPVFRGEELTLEASASDPDGDALSYAWTVPTGWTLSGSGATVTVRSPDVCAQSGVVVLRVSDADGLSATAQVAVSTAANRAPVVQSITATPPEVAPAGTITLKVAADDADRDPLTYKWTAPAGWTITGTGAQVTIKAPDAYERTATVTVEIADGRGDTVTGSIVVATRPNRAPVLASLVAAPTPVAKGGTITVTASASDPDGDALVYAWTAPAGWTLSGSGAQVTIAAPATPGLTATLGLVVTDDSGARATGTVLLATQPNQVPQIASIVASGSPAAKGGKITVTASASDADGDTLTYAWTTPAGWTLSGSGAQVTITAPATPGLNARLELAVTDGSGGRAAGSVVLSTQPNQPPQIASVVATGSPAAKGGTISLVASASDPDADALSYEWTVPAGWTLSGSGASVTVTAPSAYGASGIANLKVTDAFGGSATGQAALATVADRAPVIGSLTADPTATGKGGTITATVIAADPDGDALTYAWTVPAGWTGSSSGPSITVTAPNAHPASASLRVTVSDGILSANAAVTVATRVNRAPIIDSFTAAPATVLPGATSTLTVSANDLDADAMTYAYSLTGAGWSIAGSGASVTLRAPFTNATSTTVTVTVDDAAGGRTTSTVTVSTSSCGAGTMNCDGSPANGCEATLASDTNNCGVCANQCSAPTPACVSGSCASSLLTWSGPRTDLTTSTVVARGWRQCFSETYARNGTAISTLTSACNRANVLVACRRVGSDSLTVAAHAPRGDVFFDVGAGETAFHDANGTSWYYSPSWSMGFAPLGSGVQRRSCDVSSTQPTMRLCIHTGSSTLNGGWRCGASTGLNSDTTWERVFFDAP